MSGYTIKSHNSKQPMSTKNEVFGINNITGIYVGTVTNNKDSLHTGRIFVRIPELGSNPSTDNDIVCLLCTPFGGYYTKPEGDSNTTQDIRNSSQRINIDDESVRSYGMWTQPPSIGTQVVIGFSAAIEQGIVLGSLISKDRNHMMGGNASSQVYSDPQPNYQPAVEKNPNDTLDPDTRPVDQEVITTLIKQGLAGDWLRGHSQSSARRESPSRVFGITTLGGHVLTLDDGENKSGHSKNIRIRTRGGAQILMDDTTETVFVINHSGSAYVEMDKEGKIDIYSQSDISLHSEGDYNVHAKGSINMEAEQGVNIKSIGTGIKLHSTVGDIDIHSASNLNLQADANGNLLVAGNYKETAGRIDMNGPVADSATDPDVNTLSMNKGVKSSVSTRVPEHHPWQGATGSLERIVSGEGNK